MMKQRHIVHAQNDNYEHGPVHWDWALAGTGYTTAVTADKVHMAELQSRIISVHYCCHARAQSTQPPVTSVSLVTALLVLPICAPPDPICEIPFILSHYSYFPPPSTGPPANSNWGIGRGITVYVVLYSPIHQRQRPYSELTMFSLRGIWFNGIFSTHAAAAAAMRTHSE